MTRADAIPRELNGRRIGIRWDRLAEGAGRPPLAPSDFAALGGTIPLFHMRQPVPRFVHIVQLLLIHPESNEIISNYQQLIGDHRGITRG